MFPVPVEMLPDLISGKPVMKAQPPFQVAFAKAEAELLMPLKQVLQVHIFIVQQQEFLIGEDDLSDGMGRMRAKIIVDLLDPAPVKTDPFAGKVFVDDAMLHSVDV